MGWARQIAGPLARLLERRDWVVVKIDNRDHQRRINGQPHPSFISRHYLNCIVMIVRLSTADVANSRELLSDALKDATS